MELNQEKDKMAPEATAAEEIPAETVIEETAEAEAPVPEAPATEGEDSLAEGKASAALARAKKALKDQEDAYLRLAAEYDNFRSLHQRQGRRRPEIPPRLRQPGAGTEPGHRGRSVPQGRGDDHDPAAGCVGQPGHQAH